ncbi:MAG: ATP-binding cassette domain-containing protein [Sandaracinaceae bacterium]|nr:ATP-binding cassette domain-containing protein [Sandaracinaceae bacterium]
MTRSSRAFFAPEVVQTSAMDCGPAALKSLLGGFGVQVSYGRLREACQTDVDGTSIDTLEDLAVQLGLDAEQVMVPLDHVLEAASACLPAIAVTRLPSGVTHFVVVWRRVGQLVQVMDPGGGRRWTTVRELSDQLYVHSMPVPAEAFREYAGAPEFLDVLRARIRALGTDADRAGRWIATALEDETWVGAATLDAVVRMVAVLVEGGGVQRGAEATALVERFVERALEDASVVPRDYWVAFPHDDEHVVLTGVVLVRALGRRPAGAPDEAPSLPPDVAAALAETPDRPAARLWEMLRQDGLLAPAFVSLALATSAIAVLVEALVFRSVIDLTSVLRLFEQRAALGLAILGLLVGSLLLQIPVQATVLRMGRRLEARLRLAILQKIPRLADRYFHSRLTSDMAERAHGVHALRSLPALGATMLSSGFSLVATVAGVIFLDPSHALEVLVVAALSVALPLLLQPLMNERDLRVQSLFGSLTRFYLDALLGLVPLRAHGAERSLRREHESQLVEWERASLRLLNVVIAAEIVNAAAGVALTAWLLFGYLGGGGSLGGALLLVYWALRIPALGQSVAQAARSYPHLRNVVLRLLEPLDAPEEVAPDVVAPSAADGPVEVVLEDVTVRAGGHLILESVSARVAPGERVGVVGASGAGKSTLVGLLLGWHLPAAGRVLIDGAPLDSERQATLRQETAWLDPSVQLWNRSVLRNLRYGNEEASTPIPRILEEADLLGVLQSLPEGLSTELGEGGALVSGGEGQRVRLGRAMMRPDARLVVLDEPFRGLDRGTRRKLLRASLDRYAGATLLFVTHDVSDTADLDRVLVIEGGQIVEDGAPAALAAEEGSAYRRLLDADRALREGLWNERFRRVRLERGEIVEEPR